MFLKKKTNDSCFPTQKKKRRDQHPPLFLKKLITVIE